MDFLNECSFSGQMKFTQGLHFMDFLDELCLGVFAIFVVIFFFFLGGGVLYNLLTCFGRSFGSL